MPMNARFVDRKPNERMGPAMDLERLEQWRDRRHPIFRTKKGDMFGVFWIPVRTHEAPLKVLCSPLDTGSEEWEHVSVSLPNRCPMWEEMCRVKNLFWSPETCVVQYHPPESEYVNNAKYCLHLWRWLPGEFPRPPSILVGIKV